MRRDLIKLNIINSQRSRRRRYSIIQCRLSHHRDVYPDGLPSDYSVIATFKLTKDMVKKSWNLWQVTAPDGQEQVGLRFQGDALSLDFFYISPSGNQMLRTFHGVGKLFDGEWHKLALSVKGSMVKLLIDCEEVSVESIDEPMPVIRQGYTSIVKRAARDRSFSVCLQHDCPFLKILSGDLWLYNESLHILTHARWTSSRWTCPVTQRRPIPKAAASFPRW